MAFRARDAVRVSGLTYKQFDHTIRSGFMRPSGGGGRGRGSLRKFTMRDLLAFVLLADILRAGVPVRSVAPALQLVQRGQHLPPFEQLEQAAVWTNGRDARLVRSGERPDARSTSGAVNYLLNLGGAVRRLQDGLRETTIAV